MMMHDGDDIMVMIGNHIHDGDKACLIPLIILHGRPLQQAYGFS